MRQVAKRRRLLALTCVALGAVTLTACDPPAVKLYDAACAGTLVPSNPGTLPSPPMTEASGLVASRDHPGSWYVHNDSGDTARFFAVSDSGALQATYNVTNASAVDWEDIAIRPGSATVPTRIFIADIGDNAAARASVNVYRLAEPAIPASPATVNVTAERVTLVYPDGPRDAEAMFVHAGLNRIYIIEKRLSGGKAGVYTAPADAPAGSTVTMTRVATIKFPNGLGGIVTGADLSGDNGLLAVRTYGSVRLYKAEKRTPEAALKSTVCFGPVPAGELQGEAVAIAQDNRSYRTVAEGTAPTLHQFTGP